MIEKKTHLAATTIAQTISWVEMSFLRKNPVAGTLNEIDGTKYQRVREENIMKLLSAIFLSILTLSCACVEMEIEEIRWNETIDSSEKNNETSTVNEENEPDDKRSQDYYECDMCGALTKDTHLEGCDNKGQDGSSDNGDSDGLADPHTDHDGSTQAVKISALSKL